MRRLISAVVLALVASLLFVPQVVAQEAAQDDTAATVLRIGLTQPWETLNPTIGFAVSEYEFWNIQYATLTNKKAEDFSTIPGLAESWTENQAGISYTYTLREGMNWSDGEPLTADDIAWNINTGRDQEWSNMLSTVQNLTAEVIDERTVTITSSVPDPKLPTLDVYILPRHIWEAQAPDGEAVSTYDALDGVGSGPFVLSEYVSEQFLRLKANPNYYGGELAVDEIVFQYYSNPDAMVAALQQGQIDAAHDVPASSVDDLEADENIQVIAGIQGGFDEIALNGGQAEGQPHPALLDIEFRKAIAHALDKEAAIEDLWFGLAEAATTISPGADLAWVPDIPADELLEYDPAESIAILDAAGYVDTNGDGFREMPGGGENIVLRHAVNTDSDLGAAVGELFSGWMRAVGIDVELSSYDQDQLFGVIVDGTYDSFYWGWVPFVDPDPMLSYFTEAELGNYNDANWADPRFEELYLQQKQEVDPAKRKELVGQALRVLYDDAVYFTLWYAPDLQAYRTDTFEGWVRQPADIGPVMFSNSSPSYDLLRPVGGGGRDSGSNTGLIIGVVVLLLAAAGITLAMSRRRRTADERE